MNNLVLNSEWIMYAVVIVFAVFLVGMMVTQSARRRKTHDEYMGMLDALRVGMRVKTVGGVIGVIKEIREEAPEFKTVLLETGIDGKTSYVLYDLQAVYGLVDDEKLAQAKLAQQSATVQNEKTTDNGVNSIKDISEPKKGKGKGK